MLQCFMCGCQIREGEGQRRSIATQQRSGRLDVGRPFAPPQDGLAFTASQTRSQLEMVCRACAADIDARQKRALVIGLIIGAVVLVVFAAIGVGVFCGVVLPQMNRVRNEQSQMERDFEQQRRQIEQQQKEMEEKMKRDMDDFPKNGFRP